MIMIYYLIAYEVSPRSSELVTSVTESLSTSGLPWEPMRFTLLAASSRIDKGMIIIHHILTMFGGLTFEVDHILVCMR